MLTWRGSFLDALADEIEDALDGQRVGRLELVGLVEELFGHEAKIKEWELQQSFERTKALRPDLLKRKD